MENVEQHIEKVTSLLDDLDLNCKCKFSAWCANAILLEPTIKNTLFEITKSNATYQMLQAIIQACWYDYKLVNIQPTIELINEIDFSQEDYPDLVVGLEGLNELLIAIECIVQGILNNDSVYFANVAENTINWKDIEVEYSDSANQQLNLKKYKDEYIIQINFLENLKSKKLDNLSL